MYGQNEGPPPLTYNNTGRTPTFGGGGSIATVVGGRAGEPFTTPGEGPGFQKWTRFSHRSHIGFAPRFRSAYHWKPSPTPNPNPKPNPHLNTKPMADPNGNNNIILKVCSGANQLYPVTMFRV